MATHRVWFYKALPGLQSKGTADVQPILQEPYVSTELVDTGSGVAATAAAPAGTDAAVILPGAAVYYYVREPGVSTDASNVNRQLASGTEATIHVKPGGSVSLLEV